MRAVVDLLSLRSFAQAVALLGVGLVVANCSPDVERFNDNPFATNTPHPPSETTDSVSRGQVQSRPLPEPQTAREPLPAAKPESKLPPDEKPPAPTTKPPAEAARKVKWLPAPSEGMRSAPPDFLMNGEK